MQGNAENIWFDWRDMKGDIQTIHFQIDAIPLLCQKLNNVGEFMIEVKIFQRIWYPRRNIQD